MAVLQHAPAGYLLSVPLTELQITIKESCLSFLLASRKTYSGSFTLIFIHLVIDKCGAVQSSLPPPGLFQCSFAPSPPQQRTAPGGCSGSMAPRKTRVATGPPRPPRTPARCREQFNCILFYTSSFPPLTQPARLSRAGAVTGETGAARAASARWMSRRIFSQLREARTWK